MPRDPPDERRRNIRSPSRRPAAARSWRRGQLLIRGGRLQRAAPRALHHNASGTQPKVKQRRLPRGLNEHQLRSARSLCQFTLPFTGTMKFSYIRCLTHSGKTIIAQSLPARLHLLLRNSTKLDALQIPKRIIRKGERCQYVIWQLPRII